jgi:hypothetical protein
MGQLQVRPPKRGPALPLIRAARWRVICLARRGATLVTLLLCVASPARAERAERDPKRVTGVERANREPGDAARTVATAVLILPRAAVELVFLATGSAASLIDEEQVVPRVHELLHPPNGEIHAFPTLFVETGSGFNVGARAIARADNLGTTVRAGVGGPHDLVVESKLRLSFPKPLPFSLSLEAFHDERSSLGFLGVGQDPESDPRNQFLATAPGRSASYRERRGRFIASAGARLLSDVELLASSSVARRHSLDPPEEADTVFEVFVPGSVPGAGAVTHIVYSEVALRVDTRADRGTPSSGILLEGYFGQANGVRDTETRFLRTGGRAAAFVSLLEPSNILSPRVSLDGLDDLDGAVPFNELVRQPDFRGFDNRRDRISLVASVDYRWAIARYLAARLFLDNATVAPELSALELEGVRPAGGFGFDVFSRSSQLGSLRATFSPEGFLFSFGFGVSSGFGDRQHRN